MSVYIKIGKETHLALVSVRQKDDDYFCQVRFVDGGFHFELWPEPIVFDTNGVLKQPSNLHESSSHQLMSTTIQAISQQILQR